MNSGGIIEVAGPGSTKASGHNGSLAGGGTATNNGIVELEGDASFPNVINNSGIGTGSDKGWGISTGGSTEVANTLTNSGLWQIANSATTTVGVLLSNSGTFQIANSASASAATATSTGTFQIATAGSFSAGTLNINGGKFQVTDTGSSVTVTNTIEIGETGSGAPAFQIVNGATATSRTGIIGDVNGSNGTANIDGAGSSWTVSDHLAIGNQSGSTGTLTISNGATVSNSSQAFNDATTCIGCATGSTGTVVVAGSNTATPGTATLSIQGFNASSADHANIFVGQSGTGTLTVADGGIVTAGGGTGTIEVAVNSGSTGTLTLAQSNSTQFTPTINASTIQFGAGTGKLVFSLDPSAAYTFSPTIAGNGLVAVAAGVIVFNAKTETYTGPTAISAGATLKLTGASSISASTGVNDLGTFDISGNGGTSIQALIGTGGGLVKLGANTLTVTAAGAFTGTLGGSGDTGGFTVSGTGTQKLSATTGNYAGATTINSGGVLALDSATDISKSSGVIDNGTFPSAPMAIPRSRR